MNEKRKTWPGDARPLFSWRYGIEDQLPIHFEKEEWATRHARIGPGEMRSPEHGCLCPGIPVGGGICRQRCTQEDMLCDECREWCRAVDDDGEYHRLIDLKNMQMRDEARIWART